MNSGRSSDRLKYLSEGDSLILPGKLGTDSSQHLLVDGIAAGRGAGKEQERFLNVRCEMQQIHDLRHARLRDVGQASHL